ncbi:MFS transporter [Pseudorhodoplanes sinuspersici]|uniref:MFS transporter n=2 Tax=Pseudorhodoplanes sinuspersici TaxID=1235591 RepID=A0A1W7A0V6_9HYPH|nr:MFS transporter [Pseudorhodoplanes sinuspersici]
MPVGTQAQPAQIHLDLLDTAPMGWRQYFMWLLASGGTLLDGFSIFSLGVAMPLLTERFSLSALMVGLIGSALVLGAAFGAAFGGPAADRFGRKPALLVDMAILAIGALLSALANEPFLILAGQFLVGIGIGIDFPVSASYVSETMPKRERSRMMVATIALQSVGMLVGAMVALATLRLSVSVTDWRWIVGATGAGAILFLLFRLWLPESPRWLLEHGKDHITAPPEAALGALPVAPSDHAGPVRSSPSGYSVLFSRAYHKRTLLASAPWFLMDIATYGVGLFTPVILAAIHLPSNTSGPLAANFAAAEGSAAIDLFLLIGFLIGLWAVPRFGRIHMQIAGFSGMAMGMLLLLFAVLAGGGEGAHIALVFAGFILFNLAMNAGPNATTFTLAPELFPTGIRASASGFAAATAKVGATLGIFMLPQVKEFAGVAGVLALMAVVSAIGATITAILAADIRDIPEGRELEAISEAA